MGSPFVSPTGYVEIMNDIYAIDNKSTRGREEINPKEDLAYYFQTYFIPKYGLDNINVSNVVSFMKELEMNWSKLMPELKDKVIDIMVDNILSAGGYDFKSRLLTKLGIPLDTNKSVFSSTSNFGTSNSGTCNCSTCNCGLKNNFGSKSNFGTKTDYMYIAIAVAVILALIIFVASRKPGVFPKMF